MLNAPRLKFFQELDYGRGFLRLGGRQDRPLQVFAEFFGADAPLLERSRRSFSDSDQRPLADECERDIAIGRGPRTMK